MNARSRWTLLTIVALGRVAAAEPPPSPPPSPPPPPAVDVGENLAVMPGSSYRGIAQDYLVAPSGGELTGGMKFIMSQPSLGDQPLRFSDLALFELGTRYSVFSKLEVSASIDFLAKQPSFTDEKPWQSVGFGARVPVAEHIAVSVTGGGGHLLDHDGSWTHAAAMIEWRKPIEPEWMTFDVQGGVDGIALNAPGANGATLGELAIQTTVLFREPTGHWGAWLGLAYAIPLGSRGEDPTTQMALDPQPRLDLHLGTVLSLVPDWDLFVDFAIIDRGDLSNPATRLPILDGGFDQNQILFGVTRHLERKRDRHTPVDDSSMYL